MIKREEPKKVSLGEVAKYLNTGIDQADPARVEGFTQLTRVREVKAAQWKREQARLEAKLGKDHPRVAALNVKLNANAELMRDLKWGATRAATPAVAPQKDTWVLHGHVRNADRMGVPNLTLSLYDENNQWIEQLGYACTDANGYFFLKYKSEKVKEGAETAANAAAARIAMASSTQGVIIHVADAQKNTLYVDTNPMQPKLGEVVYREIILDGDACRCTPPGESPAPNPEPSGRYVGNSANLELHDLKNAKPRCQIDEIKPENRYYFSTQKEATSAGYDFCAYCFGKEKSRR